MAAMGKSTVAVNPSWLRASTMACTAESEFWPCRSATASAEKSVVQRLLLKKFLPWNTLCPNRSNANIVERVPVRDIAAPTTNRDVGAVTAATPSAWEWIVGSGMVPMKCGRWGNDTVCILWRPEPNIWCVLQSSHCLTLITTCTGWWGRARETKQANGQNLLVH